MEGSLNENFLVELFKLCLQKKEIVEICKKHLKYQYLPSEEYKEIWKHIEKDYSYTNTIPTLGILYQNCKKNDKIVNILDKIKDANTPREEQVMHSLEEFIKDSICISFYDSFQEIYSQGNKEKARHVLYETSEKLMNFTLSSEYMFSSTFSNFEGRQYQKKIDNILKNENFGFVVPVTGIDELDFNYEIKPQDVICFLATSGTGKTTCLTYIAVENARKGAKVLYVACEGLRAEQEDRIDSCWTSVSRPIFEKGELTDEEIEKLNKIAEQITSIGGEIETYAFEQFDTASVTDIYGLVQDYKKVHGQAPDVLLIDYLELIDPGDGKRYSVGEEKERRQAVARRIKNLTTSEKIKSTFTATQTSNVSQELLNSEEFVLTRNDISGDKNLLNSFSLFVTINQTIEEYNSEIIRLFVDKSRHSSKRKKQIIRIATDYSDGRFYDRSRSLKEFCSGLV